MRKSPRNNTFMIPDSCLLYFIFYMMNTTNLKHNFQFFLRSQSFATTKLV